MKYWDKTNRRLIEIKDKATANYWDSHWAALDIKKQVEDGVKNILIKKITTRYISAPAKVLDAGCGTGQNIYGLSKWGYESYGIDFAAATVATTKELFPEMNISVQDVRKTGFSDNYFNGYWSLGVIEHFWDGYDEILKEADRILKNDGYFFVTIPSISMLRSIKIKMGAYSEIYAEKEPDNFYQFIYNCRDVIKSVQKNGNFKLVYKQRYGAVKGIKDEVKLLQPLFQKIYDGQNIFAKICRKFISVFFDKFAGHMILLVFKKCPDLCQK